MSFFSIHIYAKIWFQKQYHRQGHHALVIFEGALVEGGGGGGGGGATFPKQLTISWNILIRTFTDNVDL